MKIKQKFLVLAGFVGALMAIVSIVGYFTANSTLTETLASEIKQAVQVQSQEVNGWLMEKGSSAQYAANVFTSFNGDESKLKNPESLAILGNDKDLLDLNVGMEDKYFWAYHAGNSLNGKDPRERGWYKTAKEAGKLAFTEPYLDMNTNKMVVSAVAPFNTNGSFAGVLCSDIGLDVLTEQAKSLKYHGEGIGIIIDQKGEVLATAGDQEVMSDVRDVEGLGAHFDEMLKEDSGFFDYSGKNGDMVFAYAKVPATGWIVGMAVDAGFVYASLNHMKILYFVLTVIGLLIAVVSCIKFANNITVPIQELEQHAAELAKGNLRQEDIAVRTDDEIGSLTNAFNTMSGNLKKLISRMASTSEQVAASSEELTANAQQSADAAVHVAETVGSVSMGVEQQITDVAGAKTNVEQVANDIQSMAEKSNDVATASEQTAAAAEAGAALMEKAIERMKNIEESVMTSAEVVKKLGESSQQIGQIVEAISAIAGQTNLLSLNAAIEAARAGEHGRGFAVVAEEVRKLAASSQESAEQIKERISAIQSDTEKAVAAMQSGTDDVKSGTAAIRDVGAQFSDILSMVSSINRQMEDIKGASTAVSVGAEGIVRAVGSIDEVTRKTATDTQTISASTEEQSASNEEIAAAAQSLANLAADMQTAIGEFKF